jgi:hypothetical protein
VILSGFENKSLILKIKHRLRVFENGVLRRICNSVIRIIKQRRLRWVGHIARMEEKRNAYRLLVGKPEGKRQLGRPRRG